jgi:8-oxo-dGTP pyrophosphatase MutT (NUDIX family)
VNILSGISESVQLMFRRPRRYQFAALCYRLTELRKPEILLLTSRDTGRWVIPKGWPMGKKSGCEVAAQEALEEAGVIGKAEQQPIGYYCYDKNMPDRVVLRCQVQVYALAVTGFADKFKEKGKRQLQWVSPKSAELSVQEPELKRVIADFATRFE